MVLQPRIELEIHSYQECVMPFNYRSMAGADGIEPPLSESKSDVLPLDDTPIIELLLGGNGKSRTFTVHRMKVLHYHYATLP